MIKNQYFLFERLVLANKKFKLLQNNSPYFRLENLVK